MTLPAAVILALCLAVTRAAAAADAPGPKVPPALAKGEALFNTNCSVCHGIGARGTTQGPPFLDKVYEPNHHADTAFYLAAEMGVPGEVSLEIGEVPGDRSFRRLRLCLGGVPGGGIDRARGRPVHQPAQARLRAPIRPACG